MEHRFKLVVIALVLGGGAMPLNAMMTRSAQKRETARQLLAERFQKRWTQEEEHTKLEKEKAALLGDPAVTCDTPYTEEDLANAKAFTKETIDSLEKKGNDLFDHHIEYLNSLLTTCKEHMARITWRKEQGKADAKEGNLVAEYQKLSEQCEAALTKYKERQATDLGYQASGAQKLFNKRT